MFKKTLLYISFLLLSSFGIKDALALDLGLTPSHVYGLWNNINQALTGLANSRLADQGAINQLHNMSPRSFSDKTPADVLKHATVFRDKLDQLKRQAGLDQTTAILLDDKEKITPSVVFLNSGSILDSLVLLVINKTADNIPIAGYFKTYSASGKSPSDVYGMVDMAKRKIEQIMANTAN